MMNITKTSKALLSLAVASSFLLIPVSYASAQSSQRCELGTPCQIPNEDGGLIYFNVTPNDGVKYQCDLSVSNNGKLVVWVTDGKDFSINDGKNRYTTHSTLSFDVVGHFEHPDNPETVGQIKLYNGLLSEGSATANCFPKK